MSNIIKAVANEEVAKNAFTTGLSLIDLFFNSIANPNEPANPASLANFAMSTTQTVFSIKNQFTNEKIVAFLESMGNISEADKAKLLKKLDKDADNFIKQLITNLERLEEKEKATVTGKLLRAVLNDKIEISEYKDLMFAIDKINMNSVIVAFREGSSKYINDLNSDIIVKGVNHYAGCRQLAAYNLMEEKITMEVKYDSKATPEVKYKLSHLGHLLAKHGY